VKIQGCSASAGDMFADPGPPEGFGSTYVQTFELSLQVCLITRTLAVGFWYANCPLYLWKPHSGSGSPPVLSQVSQIGSHTIEHPPDRINIMKTTLFALCFLCATVAFGQNAPVLNNTAAPTEFIEHTQHAAPHTMGTEGTLLGDSVYSTEHGERPLSDFPMVVTATNERPLGDIARELRMKHANATKVIKATEN
jgi:hypothetical protein